MLPPPMDNDPLPVTLPFVLTVMLASVILVLLPAFTVPVPLILPSEDSERLLLVIDTDFPPGTEKRRAADRRPAARTS